ncbi:MAG: methionyl-tRNA formyltransferase [Armatimonadota bacterium]
MRIVFMGASELGWECCRTLFEMGQDVVAIFSIPKEFRISWSFQLVTNVRYRSFEDLARAHSVPLIYVTKKMSALEYKNILQQMRPDILVVIGWYYMVPRSLREIAPLGAVGIHASLLPKYRGGAPLVWTIINGEARGGVSLFHLADGVDDGDLIGQSSFDIGLEEDIADVIRKATSASVQLVREYIPRLAAGNAPRMSQDHTHATVVPQRKPEDGLLDWTAKSALQAYNWVRAQTRPYPGAFTYLLGEKVTLWRASLSESLRHDTLPGEILPTVSEAPDAFGVWCADGRLLRVHEVEVDSGGC